MRDKGRTMEHAAIGRWGALLFLLLILLCSPAIAIAGAGTADHVHETTAEISGENAIHELGSETTAAGHGTEEGAAHAAAHHRPSFGMPMVFSLINFGLLVIAFLYLYKKKASGAFEKRSLEVKIEMEEAAEAKRQAEAKYKQYQARLDALDKEIEKIRQLAREDAVAERERLLAEAQKQTERMVEQAELTAKQEILNAKRKLRKEAAELASQIAEEQIKKAMTIEDQKNWVSSYIERIGELR